MDSRFYIFLTARKHLFVLLTSVFLLAESGLTQDISNTWIYPSKMYEISAGKGFYRHFSFTDGSKHLGPPYLDSSPFFLRGEFTLSTYNSKIRAKLEFYRSGQIQLDDGNGINRVVDSESSTYTMVPFTASYLWFFFTNNPNIGFGPALNIFHMNRNLNYYATGTTEIRELAFLPGLTAYGEMYFGPNMKLSIESIFLVSIYSLSKVRLTTNNYYSNTGNSADYTLKIRGSVVETGFHFRADRRTWIKLGAEWCEYLGKGTRENVKNLSENFRFFKFLMTWKREF